MKIELGLVIIFSLIFLKSNHLQAADGGKKHNSPADSNKINVIAHRGGSELTPENTIAAFKNALSLGVDMIEIDVILSKDDKVIVIHDSSIDRTTDGSGEVKQMTLQEIKKYDAGSWFGKKYRGEKIPILDEVIDLIDGKAILLIEIKGGDEEYPGLEKKVIEIIHAYNAGHWIIIQSFNEKTLLRVKEMDNNIITYYLLGKKFVEFFSKEREDFESGKMSNKKYNGLALHYSVLDEKNIEMIKKMGYGLFVWTVNDTDDMIKLIDAEVDGIITDLPNKLNELIKIK